MESPFDVGPVQGSELAFDELRLDGGRELVIDAGADDVLLYVFGGAGLLGVDGSHDELAAGSAALVAAGEHGHLSAGPGGLAAVRVSAGPGCDHHAPLGPTRRVVRLDGASTEAATGARSFQVLLGPHNGSTRATLFAGFIPPGKAPWHYHLYDEIVWVPEGPGRLHLGGETAELGPGAVFRLRPRQVHIVENASADRKLTVIGAFTPAGSPSAAYLTPEVAAGYRFAG